MAKSSLFGRRIHIAGSIVDDLLISSESEVTRARQTVVGLVTELLRKGATFVIPVDAEKKRSDGLPYCFDWLIWETIYRNLHLRPEKAPTPLIVAVKHHKNEEQIPEDFVELWEGLRRSQLVQIENTAHWNMNSKRMEAQSKHGDILIAIGGGEGVLYLANLYHDAGKPVIPLNFKLVAANTGALRLYDYGTSGNNARHFFQVDSSTSLSWLSRIEISSRKSIQDCTRDTLDLMEALIPPKAFVIRLLNSAHPEYENVQAYFDNVVQPVIEGELGYKLIVVDGKQEYEYARIDQEIFTKLHRSSVVLADITGLRPNCFLELGYALGRGLPTMILAKEGTEHPFDIYSLSGHHWKTTGSSEEKKREFRTHWDAIKIRPPLVPTEPLIP